jgi:hypothetical protein
MTKTDAKKRGNRGKMVQGPKEPPVSVDIVRLFKRCGYLRAAPEPRTNGNGSGSGHRGYEVRFMAHSREECQRILRMLKASHIGPGKPFNKGHQWRIPVYGRDVFMALSHSG